jgi:hypothetical protein
VRTDTPPLIDGQLTDSCWKSCVPATDFVMLEPTPGGPVTQETFAFEDISGLSANFLAGYEFAAGTMLYLVYNQQRVFDPSGINHILVAKLTYSLRF